MFTDSQLTEIRNYLLSKKLPIDILIEVNDHFISQISDLQREENLSYEDAFEKTKESWKDELKIEFSFFGDNESKIIKRIKKKQNIEFLTKTLKIYLPFLISSFLLANFSNINIFKIFNTSIFIAVLVIPIIIQFYYFKDFQLAKNYKKNQLNTMQSINSFGSIAIMYIFLFSKDLLKKSEQFFYIISGNYRRILDIDQRNATLLCVMIYLIIFWFIFLILKQISFIKKVKEVKPFLKQL
ncbi:hypothetical protein [Cloacibacterium normanense]|uniref:hypothetical protein n=1 Tax=Cloacibacterium normanense TaxID=237258 RepID=UPI00352E6536